MSTRYFSSKRANVKLVQSGRVCKSEALHTTYLLSAKGQPIVKESGFLRLNEELIQAELAKAR